ncbi:unnamed protein product [Aphanomyces euteiches]
MLSSPVTSDAWEDKKTKPMSDPSENPSDDSMDGAETTVVDSCRGLALWSNVHVVRTSTQFHDNAAHFDVPLGAAFTAHHLAALEAIALLSQWTKAPFAKMTALAMAERDKLVAQDEWRRAQSILRSIRVRMRHKSLAASSLMAKGKWPLGS